MYFKRLEIQGFKSFVDYTSLDFESGITAIVGPNGCGKSNIVDALRWVLGEQSAKALRGNRMEDVIFNGTDIRKAVGMAEVSLTINNYDRQLSTEHEEITITRRTYRSGESEYLLNKTACRLRDIQDLFLDTGIGRNAYSILEQGKIDLVISSRPADRRYVFEEAAGISKYKSRKEESLRKLDAAEQNFLRVNDIAVEVKRQIGSLERQAQKARRYQDLKQELTTLEVSRGRRELRSKRRNLRKLERIWEEQRLCIKESENRQKASEDKLTLLGNEVRENESGLSQAQEFLHQVQEEIIKTEDFIKASELRHQDLTLGLTRLEAEFEELGAKEEQLCLQSGHVLELRGHKEQALADVKIEMTAEEERLNNLEQELKEKAVHVQDQQKRLLEIVDQMSGFRETLKNLEIRRAEHEQQIENLAQRMAILSSQKQETLKGKNSLAEDLQNSRQTMETLRAQQDILAREKEKLEHTLATLNAMLDNFNQTITQLNSRLTWIEELKNGLDGYELGAKTILMEHNANPERFPGLLGPVVNFIRTDRKYEFAFEALLGHKLQYIMIETEDQARAAMDYLAEGNRGRATFIPLEHCRNINEDHRFSGEDQPAINQPGILGRAEDLARIDERFRGFFQSILKDVFIVTDAAAAHQARKAGVPGTLVTLNGELDTPERWLTGGSPDIMERGLLGREREIEELKAELSVLEINLSDALREAESTKNRREEIAGRLEVNTSELHELEVRTAGMEKSLEGVTLQMEEINRQDVSLQTENEQAVQTLNQTVHDQELTTRNLLEVELIDRQTQQGLSGQQEEIEERRREYEKRSSRAGELRVAATALEQQLGGLNADVERVAGELTEVLGRKQEKERNVGMDRKRLADLADEVNRKQEQRLRFLEDKLARERNLEKFRQGREDMAVRKEEQEKEVRDHRTSREKSQHDLHQIELEKTQLEMNLKSLENYLQEEYKLNLALEEEKETEEGPAALPAEAEATQLRIEELKSKLGTMGSVNLVAMEEYDDLQQRYEFLSKQLADLKSARENLQRLITRINHESRVRFEETFSQVRVQFREVFRRLFNGGDADLVLMDETNLLETGIEIVARPPGKHLQNISLLSGGEKALTAIALLFAIFLVKPSPFCVFDEMDAPLDDNNTIRFCRILQEFAKKSQFIIITHNKLTMEKAGVLYGITMPEAGISRIISVKFKEEEKSKPVKKIPPAAEQAVLN